MTAYTIKRTRLVSETYRVEAESENEAVDILTSEGESADEVEQIEESTHYSDIEVLSA